MVKGEATSDKKIQGTPRSSAKVKAEEGVEEAKNIAEDHNNKEKNIGNY